MAGDQKRTLRRLAVLDIVRAIAALAVCLYHFGDSLPGGGIGRRIAQHGHLGVHMFFILSGFVVPLSLSRDTGSLSQRVSSFIVGRFGRVYLPYLSAFALTLIFHYAASLHPDFQGTQPELGAHSVVAHVTLAVGEVGLAWVNPVFWTLAIECQFYLVCTLALALPAKQRPLIAGAVAALMIFSNITSGPSFLRWTPYFALGFSLLGFGSRLQKPAATLAVVSLIKIYFLGGFLTVAIAGLSVFAIFAAAWLQKFAVRRRLLLYVGAISYSLYLLHVPVGGKICNLLERSASGDGQRVLVVLVAVAASIVVAHTHYKFVEVPCYQWSKALAVRVRERMSPIEERSAQKAELVVQPELTEQ